MNAKKQASMKEVVDSRQYFQDVGVKASDVFYAHQDRYQQKARELKTTGKNEATALKTVYEAAQEAKFKKMNEEAQMRRAEINQLADEKNQKK
jgi:hypothetical protein